MTISDYMANGGRDVYYPHEELPTPPDGYHFKRMYHMGKLSFIRLEEIPEKKSCNC